MLAVKDRELQPRGEERPPQGQLEGPILTPASGGSAGQLTPDSSPVQLAPSVGRDCMCVIFKTPPPPKVAVICHSIHRKLIYSPKLSPSVVRLKRF